MRLGGSRPGAVDRRKRGLLAIEGSQFVRASLSIALTCRGRPHRTGRECAGPKTGVGKDRPAINTACA